MRMDRMDRMDLMDKMGAPRYTQGVCGAQFGVARGVNVPQGKTKQTKTNSAARLFEESAAAPTGKSVRDF